MTPTIAPTGATLDDAALEAFLTMYAEPCTAAAVEPLPDDDLAVIARAVLTGTLPALQTLH